MTLYPICRLENILNLVAVFTLTLLYLLFGKFSQGNNIFNKHFSLLPFCFCHSNTFFQCQKYKNYFKITNAFTVKSFFAAL